MTHKQTDIFVETARQMLVGSGAFLSVAHGGKHPKLVVQIKGHVLKQPFPGSPSDHRSLLNWKSQLRRRLTLIGLVQVA